jgi:hypothetical protein
VRDADTLATLLKHPAQEETDAESAATAGTGVRVLPRCGRLHGAR